MSKITHLLILLFTIAYNAVAVAEPLIVAVAKPVTVSVPDKLDKIKNALKSTDLELTYVTYPARRSAIILNSGKAAFSPYIMDARSHSDLIKIPVVLGVQEVWLLSKSADTCPSDMNQLSQYSLIGLGGLQLLKPVYLQFNRYSLAGSVPAAIKMLMAGRGDFTIGDSAAINPMAKRLGINNANFANCGDKPLTSHTFHTFVHKNYAWAVPQIEQALKAAFE